MSRHGPTITVCLLASATACPGCGVKPVELLPTPVAYLERESDIFERIPDEHRSTTMDLFYATDRMPVEDRRGFRYSNRRADSLHMGRATVRFGDPELTWDELVLHSLSPERPAPINLVLETTTPVAVVEGRYYGPVSHELTPEQAEFLESIEQRLHATSSREIVIYVHGAKVDFYNSCAITANLAHFAERDFVPLAYSWGTHQNIFAYLSGDDLAEAWHAGDTLSSLLLFLADHTDATRINVLGYSAGGRVVREALVALRHRFAELDGAAVRERVRLGTVLLAAPDVPVHTFARDIPVLHAVADRVIVTLSDADNALEIAQRLMEHDPRVGSELEEVIEVVEVATDQLDRVELLDVSYGREERGFDIAGHHYWHDHPWVLSDVILSLRTRDDAETRGLEPTPLPRIWGLPPDYPERARAAHDRVRSREGP